MIDLIIAWTILFITFIAYGDLFFFLWKKVAKTTEEYSTFDKYWIGLAFIGIVSMYITLISPLSIFILYVILIYPFIYLIKHWQSFVKKALEYLIKLRENGFLINSISIILLIAVCFFALCTPILYDFGLYHLQSMSWTEQYPVIPGLGNLHGRLAFNSSSLLLNTLFSYHPGHFKVFFSINSLSLLVLTLYIIKKIAETTQKALKVVLLSLLTLTVYQFGETASSTSTDFLPQLLIIVFFLKWIFYTEEKKTTKSFLINFPFLITVYTSFCITLKLSSATFLLVLLLSLIYLIQIKQWKIFSLMILIGVLFAIPFLTRFIILSGYLIYPYPSIDIFSFDWKMPIHLVELERDLAYSWARLPGVNKDIVLKMHFFEWLPHWYKYYPIYNSLMYISAIVISIASFFYFLYQRKKEQIIMQCIILSGIFFNILTAPDIRFTSGFIIVGIFLLFFDNHIYSYVKASVLILISLFAFITLNKSFNKLRDNRNKEQKLRYSFIFKSEHNDAKINFQEKSIDNITIYVPIKSDRCFDKELPCTPYFNNNIELRNKDLRDGFRSK